MSAGQVHDRDAEAAVLACCLQTKHARDEAARHISGMDFYQPAFERLWDAMRQLDRHGKAVDIITLRPLLGDDRLGLTALEAMPDLATMQVLAVDVDNHAAIVRGWAIRRRLMDEATRTHSMAQQAGRNASGLAAEVATRFAAVRDSGLTEDITSKTYAEILAEPDDEPDWLIPGLLERQDRLVVTGEEGLGKSHLLRQFAICAAAGLDPWDTSRRFNPVRVAIFDCENTEAQVRRGGRAMIGFAARYGRDDVAERVTSRNSSRVDITRDRDLALLHRELDALLPELVIIGPLYRLVPHAIQNDDDAAPVLAALDSIRDRGIALLIEAHAGHAIGKGGVRDLRPRGSSQLLGWPEFGYGMRATGTTQSGHKTCDFVAWRGNRSERTWPRSLRQASDGVRWVPHEESQIGWAS